jgi:hypothetical protein
MHRRHDLPGTRWDVNLETAATIWGKLLIRKDFRSFPPALWTTLCKSRPERPESLDLRGFSVPCPLSWQFRDANEIKDLAKTRGNEMMQRNKKGVGRVRLRFWG